MAQPSFRSRIVGTGEEAPDQLLANPKNWRIHPAQQQQALMAVLEDVGWVQQVVVNRRTGHLIDGHLRVSLALSREEAKVPVVYVDVSADEEALLLASLDPIAGMAVADGEKLSELLEGITVSDEALTEMLAGLMAASSEGHSREGHTDPDAVPPRPTKPKTKPGDLYEMGDHRLLCADATEPSVWERLMAGVQGGMAWTDPPYGVAYQRRERKAIANDDLSILEIETLLREAFGLMADALVPGGSVYVSCPTGPEGCAFVRVLTELGIWRQTLIWAKDVFVMGRQDYHYRHEAVLYGWKPGGRHRFRGGRTQDTVWEIPRPKRSEEHPTMKPVELVARGLVNSSAPRAIVLDPFVGSGTTIIASEQTGRSCYAMDIDPAYCDVAVTRWEAFTGAGAVRHRA